MLNNTLQSLITFVNRILMQLFGPRPQDFTITLYLIFKLVVVIEMVNMTSAKTLHHLEEGRVGVEEEMTDVEEGTADGEDVESRMIQRAGRYAQGEI
ncbi:hypothetical protein EW146_g8203 [Bondarzewia mesenterica]|uniref:Uncharacterized protein n=1 Tax=Bondarzewia mesenterica TaxID=1095465 RepID=A0A4S4LGC5_9AGAM|nr:hypothetical protein EW146_g8203 [Bondarzewia mesenterica]